MIRFKLSSMAGLRSLVGKTATSSMRCCLQMRSCGKSRDHRQPLSFWSDCSVTLMHLSALFTLIRWSLGAQLLLFTLFSKHRPFKKSLTIKLSALPHRRVKFKFYFDWGQALSCLIGGQQDCVSPPPHPPSQSSFHFYIKCVSSNNHFGFLDFP